MKKPRVVQVHHHLYGAPEHGQAEWTSRVFRGEHECISKLRLYSKKTVSRGLLKDLLLFSLMNWDRAIDLDAMVEFARKEGA
jgi:hypothetical protein